MKCYNVKQADTFNEIKKNIESGSHTVFNVMIESPVAFVHKESQVDKATCMAMGYEICEAYYNGGTILGNKGDMAFAHFGEIENGWASSLVNHLISWLKSRGLNATYEDNDILVDGFKVCGMCATRYGRIDYTAGFIGINTNLDHIKAICRKPMHKVPKGLSEYGITTEEVEEMFLEFCRGEET